MNEQDHDRLVRVEEQLKRLTSDYVSEKDTRKRVNDGIDRDLREIRKAHEEGLGDLKALLDAKIEAVRTARTSWFERVFWIFAGAVVSAVVSITVSRMGE